jgi:hypothetical protein
VLASAQLHDNRTQSVDVDQCWWFAHTHCQRACFVGDLK